MSLTTYLSKYVYRIIVKYGYNPILLDSCTDNYVSRDLTYDWQRIGEELGPLAGKRFLMRAAQTVLVNNGQDDLDVLGQQECWYLEKAQVVWRIIHSAATALVAAAVDERQALYKLCAWVTTEFDRYDDDSDTLLTVLILTSAFERALGNVYSWKSQPVPFLLRDLLRSTELMSVYGKVPIVFTQLILGCPKGLNLRNISWHGFVSPGELHPHLVSGLIVLFASLGQQHPNDQVIPMRLQFSSFESFSADLKESFPDVSKHKKEVEAIVYTSSYIPEKTCVYWRQCYQLFENNRYGDSLVLLLPLVEHCLRKVYCKVHDCPTRVLTAESTTLYTTMDEILAPSDRLVVGEGLLMALLDLTSSLSGPRLRDKLSHGECDLSSVPRWFANHVFAVALSVTHYQDIHETCPVALCRELLTACSQYRSRYHVMASLARDIATLLSQWTEWQHCFLPAELKLEPVACPHITALDQLLFPGGGSVADKVAAVQECLKNSNPSTLFRPRSELELATCLLNVVRNVSETGLKMTTTAKSRSEQWRERTLRSRARQTCLRMWSVLPDLFSALLSLLMLTTLCYRNLPTLAQRSSALRLFKSALKTVENTVILCEEEKNRWTEAHQMLSILAKSILHWNEENKDALLI